MAGANSVRSILYALGANFAIFVAKLVAAIITRSGSMMAEAIHSLADCGNQLLLLFGMRAARKPATPEYPLGQGKAIYFWSFIVALILFSMGGIFSIYEGIHKYQHPEPLNSAWIAIGVLVFGIVAEAISMRACLTEVNKVRGNRTLWRWFQESRQSELIVIFGEDLAALLGLVIALVAILATIVTGDPMYDALGSMSIGVLLVLIAIFLGIEIKQLLIGKGVERPLKEDMIRFLEEQAKVLEVLNFISLQLGEDIMVAVKVRMGDAASGRALVEDINFVENAFRNKFPKVVWLFFEPDVAD